MNLDAATLIAGLSDFLKSGIAVTVTLAPSGATVTPVVAPVVASPAPSVDPSEPLTLSGKMKGEECIQIVTQRGHVLRSYPVKGLNKTDLKILEVMRVCASEGWHLWEMQFACYCFKYGFAPDYGNRPYGDSYNMREFEPLNFNFGFVRDAFLNYSKCKRSSLVAKLKAI